MTGIEPIKFVAMGLVSSAAKKFGIAVIERWTRYRANRFFEAFLSALKTEAFESKPSADVDQALDRILADKKKSEVLYDSYRRVCFSASKTIGPRIIGLLTGRLVNEARMSKDDEERIFRAAELLSDADFEIFRNKYYEYSTRASRTEDKQKDCYYDGNDIVIIWNEESRDSAWSHSLEQEIEVSPLDLDAALGYWAVQLKRCGLIGDRITERQAAYHEDSERHIDQDGVLTTYTSTVTFYSACKDLYDLVSRSLGANRNPPEQVT